MHALHDDDEVRVGRRLAIGRFGAAAEMPDGDATDAATTDAPGDFTAPAEMDGAGAFDASDPGDAAEPADVP